jgi:leucyl aminopeptidase (aminopeptidase T)
MMSKQQAKEVMVRNLPIHEGVLRKVLDVIGPLATRIAEARHMERASLRPDPKNRAHIDPSHHKTTASAFQQANGRLLTPLEVSELEEQKRKQEQQEREMQAALARQQQEQQQQQQALALQQQQQQAAAAAAMQQQQQQQQQLQQQQQQQQQAAAAAAAAQQGGMPGANAAMVAAAQQQQQAAMAAAQQQAAQQQAAALAAQGMGQVRSVTPGGTVVGQGPGPGMNAMQGAGEVVRLASATNAFITVLTHAHAS